MDSIINDFSIMVATPNGSGSQSANSILMRSIFEMGIPVSGKNLFPSNIQGLPTWFTIRASKDGYVARRDRVDVLVAMNPATVAKDVVDVSEYEGSVMFLNSDGPIPTLPEGALVYKVPFQKLVAECCPEIRLRKMVINIIYVGVLANLLSIDMECVESALEKQFPSKKKAIEFNLTALKHGFEYAANNLEKIDPFKLEKMDAAKGKIIIEGNAAGALGAMFGGCTVVAWYPITPSSSVAEAAIDYFDRFRKDKDGKTTYSIVQMEDELASIGMVIGAGWGGARAMTATSGPGISLMSEFVGFAYFAEVPAVIWDVQRVGPSTGLPTRTMQGDLTSAYTLSHGDTRHIVLLPASVEECFEFGYKAFDLSDRFQTPVFVLSDLDLGMNSWMSDPFEYPSEPMDHGKILSAEDLEKVKSFGRYKDVDGDGICYRTVPGTHHPLAPYFARGSGHNAQAQYSEAPEDYVEMVERIRRKIQSAGRAVPESILAKEKGGSEIGVIAYGTTHHAIVECRDQLRAEGVVVDYLRVRALPFDPAVREFIRQHKRVYVVEQNLDGQMLEILRMELGPEADNLRSIRYYTGIPLNARFITRELLNQEQHDPQASTEKVLVQ